jgi:hypothetical protein
MITAGSSIQFINSVLLQFGACPHTPPVTISATSAPSARLRTSALTGTCRN